MTAVTKEDLAAIAEKAYRDPVFFCKYFMPTQFPGPVPWFHKAIMAILDRNAKFLIGDPDYPRIQKNFIDTRGVQIFNDDFTMNLQQHVMLMIGRGFAKTTIAGQAMPLKRTLYRDAQVILYISSSSTHAEMQLNNLKNLCESPRVTTVFGRVKPDRNEDLKWRSDLIETTFGSAMIARGSQGQVRGLNWNGIRPKLIIIDDLEDKETVQSPDQRHKQKEWLYADVIPALAKDPNAQLFIIGTLIHPASVLTVIRDDQMFTSIILDFFDKDGVPIWEEHMGMDAYNKLKSSYANAGTLSTFYLEYHQKAVATEEAKFRPDYIRMGPMPPRAEMQVAIMIDPAISQSLTSDWAVIYVVGMGKNGYKYVLDCWRSRTATAYEQVEAYFMMCKRWRPQKHGFESQAFQKALGEIMREAMFRQKYYFEAVPVNQTTSKISRVEGILQPQYAAGYMVHTKQFPELVEQLMDWPNVAIKDDADCLASCVQLLEPFAGLAASPDSFKDAYPPLEDMVGGELVSI